MQIGHQRRDVAMRVDQLVVHVGGMAGHVAKPVEPGDFGEAGEKAAEAPRGAVRALAMPGIDVLAEQRDLAHPGPGKPRRFRHDRRRRTRNLGAARIGDDAERAELVAALLDGEEGGDAAGLGGRGAVERRELLLHGEIRGDRTRACRRLGEDLGQAMIGLRADDEVDQRRAGENLGALGLRDAAGDADHYPLAGRPRPPP